MHDISNIIIEGWKKKFYTIPKHDELEIEKAILHFHWLCDRLNLISTENEPNSELLIFSRTYNNIKNVTKTLIETKSKDSAIDGDIIKKISEYTTISRFFNNPKINDYIKNKTYSVYSINYDEMFVNHFRYRFESDIVNLRSKLDEFYELIKTNFINSLQDRLNLNYANNIASVGTLSDLGRHIIVSFATDNKIFLAFNITLEESQRLINKGEYKHIISICDSRIIYGKNPKIKK